MPITKSAIKKVRRDKKKTLVNARTKVGYRQAVKAARRKPTKDSLKKAAQALDRAAKKKVIHRNKAARLKSRLNSLLKTQQPAKKTAKKAKA